MATVIDSLVVQLGLDSSKFTRGQQEAIDKLKKFEDETRRAGGKVEDNSRKAADSLSNLRTQVLALGAVAIGGGGLIAFASSLTQSALSLGFLSHRIGTSVETLSLWRNAARLATGSGEGMVNLFGHLNDELQTLNVTGTSAIVPWLNALEINAYEANGQIKESGKIINEVLSALDKGADPGKVAVFLRGIGADPETLNFLLQSNAARRQYLDLAEKIGVATRQNADDAQKATTAWNALKITFENLGNKTLAMLYDGWEKLRRIQNGEGPVVVDFNRQGARAVGTTGLGGASGVAVGDGAAPGGESAGIFALKRVLAAQGFRITSTMGGTHSGTAHGAGLALDFVPPAGRSITDESTRLRAELARMGIGATVIDATTPDSPSWTGPHSHVQFNSPADAAKYSRVAGQGGGAGNTTSSTVNIAALNVNTKATDATGIARDIGRAMRTVLAAQANSGQSK